MSRPRSERPNAMAKQRRRQQLRQQGIYSRDRKGCAETIRRHGYDNPRFGEPCQASRAIVEWKGKLYRAKWCYAHIPDKYRERWGLKKFGGPDNNQGRPRIPKLTELMREQVEQQAAEFLLPLFEAMLAEKPVVVGNGRFARIELHPDHRTRLAAFQEMVDRIYGKAKQTTELTGNHGGPIEIQVPMDSEREQEVAAILAQAGALRNVDPKAVAASMIKAHQNPVNQN